MTISQQTTAQQLLRIDIDLGVSGCLTHALVARVNGLCDQIEEVAEKTTPVVVLALNHEQDHPDDSDKKDVYLIGKWEKALRRLEQLRAAIVCTMNGEVGRLGTAIVAVSDYRIASNDSSFDLKGIDDKVMPGCVLQRLTWQLGSGPVRAMVLFGQPLLAQRALALGLVDELSDDGSQAANRFVDSLSVAQISDIAVRRHLLHEAFHLSYEVALGTHLAACDRLLRARQNETGEVLA